MRLLPLVLTTVSLAPAIAGFTAQNAFAQQLTKAQIGPAMINKTIVTRRFGVRILMRYRSNGKVTAQALIGSVDGTWRYSGKNKVCTTFPSGPAKGTDCVSFTKIGKNKYRSSKGVVFTVSG